MSQNHTTSHGFVHYAVIQFPYLLGGGGGSALAACLRRVGGGLKPGFNGKSLLRRVLGLWGRYREEGGGACTEICGKHSSVFRHHLLRHEMLVPHP